MTDQTTDSRLTRFWTSWLSLCLAVLVLAAIGIGLGWRFQREASAQADTAAAGAAYLIASTTVGPALAGGQGHLDSKAIDVAVTGLMAVGGVDGLSVWLADGTVLYHRGVVAQHGPGGAAFRAASLGSTPVDYFHPDGDEAMSLQVLLPFGPPNASPAPMVVGVTMPSELIVSLTTWATVKLFGAIVVGGAFLVICLFGLQRRLRRRSFEACHDTMTGLANRSLLEVVAGRVLRQGSASLLLMDLDGFKRVNDHLGHATGDELLVAVSGALREAVRPGDLLSRLGGDEFAILLPTANEAEARAVAERLLTIVQRQFVVRGVTVEVDASLGVASSGQGGVTFGELLSAADVAMYRAKRDRLGVCTSSEAGSEPAGDLSLLVELRRAIPAGELELYYQPALGMRSSDGDFVEALVRWNHPERGMLMPGDFIPLAEETALIHPLTEWVIDQAVRQCATWRLDGLPVRVAVNVSPRSLIHHGLVRTVAETLARHRLLANALHIEVTESAIIARPDTARAVIAQLQASGVTVSIDDFGAGYTSLAHLKRMPVEVLKIDRLFVRDLLNDLPDQAIVTAVIELGHRLGMTVVAEGVEDQLTLERLDELGCDVVQGFHISKPASAALTTEWLRNQAVQAQSHVLGLIRAS